jgi:hypothetical protein
MSPVNNADRVRWVWSYVFMTNGRNGITETLKEES